jgi:hypothetical protein
MSGHTNGIPRPPAGPSVLVVQLKAGQEVAGVILSNHVWGVGTHWNDRAGKHGRSERCTKEKGECSGCNGELSYRWKGYLYVYCQRRRKGVFVELTPAVGEALDLKAPKDKTLRGLFVKLKRGDGGDKTQISCEVSTFLGDMQGMPADRDPHPTLEMLWNWRR